MKTLALSLLLTLSLAVSTYGQYPWSPVQPVWPQYGPYIPANIYPAYTFAPIYPVQPYIVDGYGTGGYYFGRPIYYRPYGW